MEHLAGLLAYLRSNIGAPLTQEMARDIALLSLPERKPVDVSAIEPLEHPAGVTFQCERMQDVIEEIRPLHMEHWQETEGYRHALECKPDYEAFIADEQLGRFILFTVRTLDTRQMVGNCAIYLHRSRHTGDLVATEDTIFISPAWRKGRIAIDLFKYGEQTAMRLGAAEARVSVKSEKVARLWRRLGYVDSGISMSKILKEKDQ